LPKLYVSCGRQDGLYPLNLLFRQACEKLNLPLYFHETAGGHQWSLWDREIASFLVHTLKPKTREVAE
jgi:enterochelin esterase-like enzyme